MSDRRVNAQPYAVCWRDDATADVILNIVVDPPAGPIADDGSPSSPTHTPSKRQRTEHDPVPPESLPGLPPQPPLTRDAAMAGATAAAAASGGTTRTLFLHSLVLTVHSDYFKTRLQPAAATAALICDDGGSRPGPLKVLTERVDSGEGADALEAALRYCYSHLLCEVGADVVQVGVAELLHMVDLSDKYMMTLCLEAALEEIASRNFSDCDTPSAVHLFTGGLPPSAQSSQHAAAIQGAAQLHLRHQIRGMATAPLSEGQAHLLRQLHLDDAEAVCTAVCAPNTATSCRLDLLLPHLPFQALLHLLQGTFTARSENSVLMMVDEWVAMHATSTCPAQHLQLSGSLRLGRLSRAFTFEVLAAMRWLRLLRAQHQDISRFSTATPTHQAAMLSSRSTCPSTGMVGLPGWYAPPRTVWPGPAASLDVCWDVSKAEVQAALLTAHTDVYTSSLLMPRSPPFFCNGVTARLGWLICNKTAPADAKTVHLVLQLSLGSQKYQSPVVACQTQLAVIGKSTHTVSSEYLMKASGLRFISRLHQLAGDKLLIESWAPCLGDGDVLRVRGKLTIEVDESRHSC